MSAIRPELEKRPDGRLAVAKARKRAAAKSPTATSRASRMRRFVLDRSEDVSGTSGVGVVAEGVVFSNGWVAYTWLTPLSTVTFCQSVDVLEKLHGHDGRARVRFVDAT